MTARLHPPTKASRTMLAGLLVLALGGASCSLHERIERLFGGRFVVDVTVSGQLNDFSPVPVELVVVYDAKLLAKVQAMTAQQWFQNRKQFFRDNPSGTDHWLWEWVPGQKVERQKLSYGSGLVGSVIFAGYFSTGDHRRSVDIRKSFHLDLAARDFSVGPLE